MRTKFKTSRICSSDNFELSIKTHKELYPNKWDILFEEINVSIPYYIFLGKKIIIKKRDIIKVMRSGIVIHFE